MKKYKLIKEYPGSPKLGSIIMDTNPNNGAKDSWFEENWGKAHKLSFKLGINTQPDKFPEFWQKVVEKDYEILEYKTENGFSCKAPFLPNSHQFYINERCKIHSVKRLSDGEVFTIGDKIVKRDFINYIIQINFISLLNNSINLHYTSVLDGSAYTIKLDRVDKYIPKTPLFKTEDGVDIFHGMYYYHVSGNFNITERTANLEVDSETGNKYDLSNGHRYFSTKEKAEEYVLLNKPCLSLNDIFNTITWLHFSKEGLMNLFKSKLKL